MTNENRSRLTEIVFILDRSGSMSGLEADTIGGIAFEHLGGIPEKGDEVTVDRFHIRVVDVQGRRITKVEVTLLPPAEQDDEDDE